MVATHLLELKKITDAMVLEGRITSEEQVLFLEKAGLTVSLIDNTAVDESGSKYSFA